MEEKKTLFDAIKEVCDENDWLRKRNKCLKEEIYNKDEIIQSLRDDFKEVTDNNIALTNENKRLLEEIDDKDEIIQSLHDEIEARCAFTKKVIKEKDNFCNEMKLMVKDHEEECTDYEIKLKSKVDIDDIHIIIAEYISNECVPEYAMYTIFKIVDKIKEYIDSNKKEW